MTEAEWGTCADLRKMLNFLERTPSDRKLRLFSVACCRRIWRLLPDNDLREAVEVANRFAESEVTIDLLQKGELATYEYAFFSDLISSEAVLHEAAGAVYQLCQAPIRADLVASASARAVRHSQAVVANSPFLVDDAHASEVTIQRALLRDIFGNPFRAVTAEPSWLTPTVVSVATAIYDERAFDRLPVLADALEDAGCTNADLLHHCRQPGEHVRGCWCVDLVLNRQ